MDDEAPVIDDALPLGGRARFRRALRTLTIDLAPLRAYPDYRRLWTGITVSHLGSQMTLVAVPVQVYQLTGSSLAVGMIGAVGLVPLIIFGLYGGALADAIDRRRLAIFTSSALFLSSAVFMAQAIAGLNSLWLLYLLVAVQAALFAVDSPTRSAMIPRLVPSEHLPSANALSQLTVNLALAVGPLLAGVLIAVAGLPAAYGLDALSFVVACVMLAGLPKLPPEGTVRRAGFRSVVEGLEFVRTRPVVLVGFLVDIAAMVLALPRALYPEIADTVFEGSPAVVGLLFAAPGIGALTGALLSGWMTSVRRHGRAVIAAVLVWGAAITLFGLSPWLWLALVFLAVAGAADMVSAVFRASILQAAAPDEMRGRMFGLHIVVVTGGPRLADVRAGAVATLFSPVVSVVSGGIACLVATALLALRFPAFLRYDAGRPAK